MNIKTFPPRASTPAARFEMVMDLLCPRAWDEENERWVDLEPLITPEQARALLEATESEREDPK